MSSRKNPRRNRILVQLVSWCVSLSHEIVPSLTKRKLNGLGSDELLGGYGRHRTTYFSGGWQAVIDEVWHSLSICTLGI